MTDGWTNIRGEAIINYVVVSPEGQSLFIKSDPTDDNRHTKEYLAEELIKVIQNIGPNNVNAICSDTAANMLSAVDIVAIKYKFIHHIKCTSHQLNLVVKDILELDRLKQGMGSILEVAKYLRLHHIPLFHLKEEMQKIYGKVGTPCLPVSTRWQSNLDCIRSVLDFERAYKSVILNGKVLDVMNAKGKGGAATTGQKVLQSIEDPLFWQWCRVLHKIVAPLTATIITMECDVPRLSKVYSAYRKFFNIPDASMPFHLREDIVKVLKARWNKRGNVRLTLACVLDVSLSKEDRSDPDATCFKNISTWLSNNYGKDVEGKDSDIVNELVQFLERTGQFSDPVLWSMASSMNPVSWWKRLVNGSLADLAVQLLSVIPSSAAAERCWSSFG